MHINPAELLNVVLAVSILTIVRGKKTGWLLGALFTYGSLYFLYSAIPLVTGAPLDEISAMHVTGVGSDPLVKISSILFLFAMFVALGIRAKMSVVFNTKVMLYFFAVMAMVFAGYLINFRAGDRLQLQNVMSVEGMLVLILLGYMGCRSDATGFNISRAHLFVFNCTLLLAASVAFYEVFSQRAWAGTGTLTGLQIIRANRASSIFFNPNLYAYWSSLALLGYAWGIYKYSQYRYILLTGMCIASVGLYFSGGRSASILLLGTLFLAGVFTTRESKVLRWIPFAIPIIIFSLIYAASRFAFEFSFGSREGWGSVAVLGERLAATPINFLQYLLNKTSLTTSVQWLVDVGPATPQIIESIEGRFMVNGSDSGFITLFMDTGLLGLAAVFFLWGVLFARGINRYLKNPDANGVYSVALLLHCFIVGFAMRFQVFPVWLLIGVSLAFCMHLWNASEVAPEKRTPWLMFKFRSWREK